MSAAAIPLPANRHVGHRTVSLAPRGSDFTRACIALAVKATANALTTSGAAASQLVGAQSGVGEFFALVSERSIIGRLAGLRRPPAHTRLLTATGATARWVGESRPMLVSNQSFAQSTLSLLKVAGISVATRELLVSSDPSAEATIRADLVRAVVEAIDTAFINPANAGVAGVTPASITNGVAAITATASASADLKDLVDAFDGDLDSAYLVMPPVTAIGLSGAAYPNVGARDGTLSGVPVITSRHVPAGTIVLVDPTGIALSEGESEIETFTDGALTMETTSPMTAGGFGSPDNPAGTTVVSLYQSDAVAILVSRRMNWDVVRPGAVGLITGAAYGG
jgi:hypothetical protein